MYTYKKIKFKFSKISHFLRRAPLISYMHHKAKRIYIKNQLRSSNSQRLCSYLKGEIQYGFTEKLLSTHY